MTMEVAVAAGGTGAAAVAARAAVRVGTAGAHAAAGGARRAERLARLVFELKHHLLPPAVVVVRPRCLGSSA